MKDVRKNIRGFTLIELMVVISIIVVIVTIGLANYQLVNKKARDSRRESDLEQLRVALEIYKSDNGLYPDGVSGVNWFLSVLEDDGYISSLPQDPSIYRYFYREFDDGLSYELCAYQEASGDLNDNCGGLTRCTWDSAEICNYAVTNP